MTDREASDRILLELAAKAAGFYWRSGADFEVRRTDMLWELWDPLNDDGDALRLAVALGLNVFHTTRSSYALPPDDDGNNEEKVSWSDVGGDPYAATRRAIVRAAAEIGKQME